MAGWMVASLLWVQRLTYPSTMLAAFLGVGVLVFGLVPRLAGTVEGGVRTTRLVVLAALGVVALGFVPGLGDVEGFAEARLKGGFLNPNGLGLTVAVLAPWVLVWGWERRGVARVLAYGLVAVLGALAFLSGSRTGFGGYVLGLSVAAFLRFPSRFLLLTGLAGIAVSLLAVATGGEFEAEERAAEHLVRPESIERLSGRLEQWQQGMQVFLARPLSGNGYMHSWDVEERNYHSQHVETLVDLGIVGEVLLLLLLATLFRRFLRLAKAATDPAARAAGAAMTGTFMAAALDSFFHSWFLRPGSPYALIFWCLAGVSLRLERTSLPAAAPVASPFVAPSPA